MPRRKTAYAHFMLKEIHQQADVLRQTLAGRIETGSGARFISTR